MTLLLPDCKAAQAPRVIEDPAQSEWKLSYDQNASIVEDIVVLLGHSPIKGGSCQNLKNNLMDNQNQLQDLYAMGDINARNNQDINLTPVWLTKMKSNLLDDKNLRADVDFCERQLKSGDSITKLLRRAPNNNRITSLVNTIDWKIN